jgi:pseudouridine-5'-phosphate glycosidase
MLRIRYPIIQPHLDNPCPSLIEVSMMLVMVLTCGHSSKLDVLETLEVLMPTNVSTLGQLEESFRPIKAQLFASFNATPCSLRNPLFILPTIHSSCQFEWNKNDVKDNPSLFQEVFNVFKLWMDKTLP